MTPVVQSKLTRPNSRISLFGNLFLPLEFNWETYRLKLLPLYNLKMKAIHRRKQTKIQRQNKTLWVLSKPFLKLKRDELHTYNRMNLKIIMLK